MSNAMRAAFSLIEMAVVIGIIALVLGFGISLGTNAVHSAEQVNTQQRMAVLKRALDDFADANGYLPCPADRTLTPFYDVTNFGVASCTPTGTGIVDQENLGIVLIGAVPVRTLGLPDSYAADAWNNKFTYAVSTAHGSLTAASYRNSKGAINIMSGTGTWARILTSEIDRGVVGNTSTDIGDRPNATYVVISHGADGCGAYPIENSAVVVSSCSTTRLDALNYDDIENFQEETLNDGSVDALYFDDYVVWGSGALRFPELRNDPDIADGGVASGTAPACVTGCEVWCAPCGGSPTVAHIPAIPSSFEVLVDGSNGAKLCRKIITSTSPCTASCLWSGTIGGNLVRCP